MLACQSLAIRGSSWHSYYITVMSETAFVSGVVLNIRTDRSKPKTIQFCILFKIAAGSKCCAFAISKSILFKCVQIAMVS